MELDQQTQALINGIKQTTNQSEQEIVKQAVESQAEELGKQLILQQGAQQQQQEASMTGPEPNVEELETEE